MRCFHGVDSDSNSLGGIFYKMREVTDGSFFFAKSWCLEFESRMFLRKSEHSAILPVRVSCLVRLVLLANDAREFAWGYFIKIREVTGRSFFLQNFSVLNSNRECSSKNRNIRRFYPFGYPAS